MAMPSALVALIILGLAGLPEGMRRASSGKHRSLTKMRWLAKCESVVPNSEATSFSWIRGGTCKCRANYALVSPGYTADSVKPYNVKPACGDGMSTTFSASAVKGEGCTCQPVKTCSAVQTQQSFNFEQYISRRWYAQAQMITKYLPEDGNNCVTAKYSMWGNKTFWGYTVKVENAAVFDSGEQRSSVLCAYSTDKDDPAKLAVAPCELPRAAAGPYWVLAYDETQGYALISGGQPSKATPYGCRTGTGTNDSGLWIFTRESNPDEDLIQKVEQIAADQGFDLGALKTVRQTGCEGREGY